MIVSSASSSGTSPTPGTYTPRSATSWGGSNPCPSSRNVSARKHSSCSTLSTSPWRKYSPACATAPAGASDSPVISASGSASPPSASSAIPCASQRSRNRSKPPGQPRRPPRIRHRTTRASTSRSSISAAASAPAGFTQRTSGKSLGRRSTALAAARISVSAVVTKRSTAAPPRLRRAAAIARLRVRVSSGDSLQPR